MPILNICFFFLENAFFPHETLITLNTFSILLFKLNIIWEIGDSVHVILLLLNGDLAKEHFLLF